MIKKVAAILHLGRILYRIYHAPKNFLKKTLKRGIINSAVDYKNQCDMEQAAYGLKPFKGSACGVPLEIYFLSGKRFWYQTCFCAYSLMKASGLALRPVVYDDDTLESGQANEIKRIFPEARIIGTEEMEERLEKYLPALKFPHLRERRINYKNIRKLTDPHIGSSGWKAVLDSDMLFFRNPVMFINWLRSPQQPCHMVDAETSYGYPFELMESLIGMKMAERVNVGICGLKSEAIDWYKLEYWCRSLIAKAGTHYYMEQALIAMLLAGESSTIFPANEYLVMPSEGEVRMPTAVLHHYVDKSRPWYFRYGWKNIKKERPSEV
jgi:hypothetical protein